MKVTQIRSVRPVQGVSTIAGGGGGISGTGPSGTFPPSGQIPTASGSNTWSWGSNVAIITSNGSNQLMGPFVNFASGTGIAFAAASNTLTISNTGVPGPPGSGSATDETIPSGGTLYDGTSTSGWTQFGTGGLTTFDANSTVPGALYLAKTSTGGNNDYGVFRSISSLPRIITAKIKAADMYQNYHFAGIMYGDSTPTAHQTWTMTHDTTNVGSRAPQRYAWTSPTSAGANTVYPGSSSPGLLPNMPFWLRLVINSSTDVEYWASWDGYLYFRFASAINPGFTVATFGLVIAGFGIDMRAAFDWIHQS